MLGKIWKKILMFILIVACLWSITSKLVQRQSLKTELESTLDYFNNETTQNLITSTRSINNENT